MRANDNSKQLIYGCEQAGNVNHLGDIRCPGGFGEEVKGVSKPVVSGRLLRARTVNRPQDAGIDRTRRPRSVKSINTVLVASTR